MRNLSLQDTGEEGSQRHHQATKLASDRSKEGVTHVDRHDWKASEQMTPQEPAPLIRFEVLPLPGAAANGLTLSAEKATEVTELLCSSSVWRHCPIAASQSLTVRPSEADARCVLSAEKATEAPETGGGSSRPRRDPTMLFRGHSSRIAIKPLQNRC